MRYRRLLVGGASYFFTVVTHDRQRLFSDPQTFQMLADAITKVRERHPFEIEAQVILPDHLHSLWTMPDGDANFGSRWRLIKEACTRTYCKCYGSQERSEVARARGEQPVWQRRFWEHLIRDEPDFSARVDYIHLNPVRHGLVSVPGEWPHSTFAKWVERGVYDPNWGEGEKPEVPERARWYE